jgi:hypothetical protein
MAPNTSVKEKPAKRLLRGDQQVERSLIVFLGANNAAHGRKRAKNVRAPQLREHK